MIAVLVIALEFAPVQSTGAFRSIDLVARLPHFGFKPIVASIEAEEAASIFGAPINPSIACSLPADLHRLNLACGERRRREGSMERYWRLLTNLNDRFYARYSAPLATEVRRLMSQQPIAAVYVSAPPFGAAALGMLAARITGAPLVLDMRDAWAAWTNTPLTTYAHYLARRLDEERAFKAADHIITVTDQLREVFLRDHPTLEPQKVSVVPNGFNGPDFVDAQIFTPGGRAIFNIAYVGSYYWSPPDTATAGLKPHRLLQFNPPGENWSYRSPLYFFKAWQALSAIDPDSSARIHFHHIGDTPPWLSAMAEAHDLRAQCTFHGMIPKQKVQESLGSMDAVLATSMKRAGTGDYCLASKTFDYIQARKPILAFVTQGAQLDFLIGAGAAILVDPDNSQAAARALSQLVRDGAALKLNSAFVNRYSRDRTARRAATILHNMIAECEHRASPVSGLAPLIEVESLPKQGGTAL